MTVSADGAGQVTLAPLVPVEDFPRLPAVLKGAAITAEAAPFKELIGRVSVAMAAENSRFAIAGVMLDLQPGCLTATATDGHKLIEGRIAITSPWCEKFVIGTDVVRVVKQLPDVALALRFAKGMLAISWAGGTLITKALDKNFPDYAHVIPRGNPFKALVSRQALMTAMARIIKLLPTRGGRAAKFSFSADSLVVSAGGNGDVPAVESGVPASFTDAPLEIGFNASYVREALGAFPGEEVEMRLSRSGGAMWMFPAGGGGALSCTLMPCKV